MEKQTIYGLTRDQLIDWAIENGEKKFRATQVWDWLYRKRVQTFEEMTNLSKDFIAKLNAHFIMNPLEQVVVQESEDGTVKYLFMLPDKMMIETVLMRQSYGLSVCVTTQVGCNMGCTFCASGILKKERDVTAGEIVAQIMLVQKYFDEKGQDERVSHVVVMGIGEPFDNYVNLMNFLRTRLKMSEEEISYTISDFILIITCDDKPFDAVSKMLDRKNILMTKSQLEDFIKLFTDLINNTRLPQNRGFTPLELSANRGGQKVINSISFGPNITAALKSGEVDIEEYRKGILMSELSEKVKMDMLRQLSQIEGKNTTQKKVGRNDPCPCGSGKKYKKCCGK